jgi:hypothetical protein
MNQADPKTGIVGFLHCTNCLKERINPSVTVGISAEGDLVVWCNNHDSAVARVNNDTIAEELRGIAGLDCACGKCQKETLH